MVFGGVGWGGVGRCRVGWGGVGWGGVGAVKQFQTPSRPRGKIVLKSAFGDNQP